MFPEYISLSANLGTKKTMTDSEFTELCIGICRELDCEDIYALAETGEFILEEVRIGLYYTEQDDEPISCFVDIGLIEEGLRAAVFEKILVLNLEINGVNGESLGFSRNSGHLVLRANIQPESGCTAVQLARCLSDYVQFVHKLRTEILNDKEVHSDALFLALV